MVIYSDQAVERIDVIQLYSDLLDRKPESDEVLSRTLSRKLTKAQLVDRFRGSPEFIQRARAQLLEKIDAVDGYQALYGIPSLSADHGRNCNDRCEAIQAGLSKYLGLKNLQHLRLADIGCSMGYVPAYFADRGAQAYGYDIRQENVDFCNSLFRLHNLSGGFTTGAFSDNVIDEILKLGVNTVSLLSVLHHVVLAVGIESTRSMLRRLLDAGILLICELATKAEAVEFSWKDTLPEHELDIFEGDDLNIKMIDTFSALNGVATRHMYFIQKQRFAIANTDSEHLESGQLASNEEDAEFLQFSQVESAPVPFKQYGITPNLFIKFFRISDVEHYDTIRRLNAEFMCAQRLDLMGFGPKVIGLCGSNTFRGIVTKRINPAKTLIQWSLSVSLRERRKMALDIARCYKTMVHKGIYWNDFRDHNIIVDGDGNFFLIDFELASAIELEDNDRRAMHTLWNLATNERWSEYHSGVPTKDLVFTRPLNKPDHLVMSELETILDYKV